MSFKMASALQASIDSYRMLSNSLNSNEAEDESFVILGKSIDPSFESLKSEDEEVTVQEVINHGKQLTELVESKMETSVKLPSMPLVGNTLDGDVHDGTISISTISSEYLPEDLQLKINEMIEENTQLKKTICENNSSFKSQRDRILSWQQEVQKVLDDNKKQFKEAKSYIEILKQENAKLIHELEHIKQASSCKDLKDASLEIQKLKDLNNELEQALNQEKAKLTEVTPTHKELQDACVKIEQLKLEKESLQTKDSTVVNNLQAAMDKNNKLKQEVVKLELENKSLIAKLSSKNIQEELDTAYAQILELKQINNELTNEKTKAEETSKAINKELNAKISAYNLLELQLELHDNKLRGLEKDNKERSEKLKQGMDKTVENCLQETNTLKGQLDSCNKYIEQLRIENKNLSHLVASANEQLVSVQQQLMQTQMKLSQVNAERSVLDDQLTSKTFEFEKTLEDKENMFKMQLDIYKNDFEVESEAKNSIRTERDRLAEDLANIQRRNNELQEEIELLRENEYVVPPSQNKRVSSASSVHSNTGSKVSLKSSLFSLKSPPASTYSCPICHAQFRSIRLVQEHVEICPQMGV